MITIQSKPKKQSMPISKSNAPRKRHKTHAIRSKHHMKLFRLKKEEVPSSEKSAEQVISAEQKAFASSILGAKLKSTDSRSIEERLAERTAAKLAEQTAAKLPKKFPLPRN